MDIAGQAKQDALRAIVEAGRLGGSMSDQDYRQRADAARARDEISRYNAGAHERADSANRQSAQQQYQNEMGRNSAMADINAQQTGYGYKDAQSTRNFWSGMGQAGGAYVDDAYGDPKKKKG